MAKVYLSSKFNSSFSSIFVPMLFILLTTVSLVDCESLFSVVNSSFSFIFFPCASHSESRICEFYQTLLSQKLLKHVFDQCKLIVASGNMF